MPKSKHTAEDVFMKPLPSLRVPWLVILALVAAIVVFYFSFLRPADQLWGPELKPNEWIHHMQEKPKPATPPAPAPAAPAATTPDA